MRLQTEGLGHAVEGLGRRLLGAVLDLGDVRVGEAGLLGQFAPAHVPLDAVEADGLPQGGPARLFTVVVAFCHRPSLPPQRTK